MKIYRPDKYQHLFIVYIFSCGANTSTKLYCSIFHCIKTPFTLLNSFPQILSPHPIPLPYYHFLSPLLFLLVPFPSPYPPKSPPLPYRPTILWPILLPSHTSPFSVPFFFFLLTFAPLPTHFASPQPLLHSPLPIPSPHTLPHPLPILLPNSPFSTPPHRVISFSYS